MRSRLVRLLPWLTGLCVVVQLLSLRFGLLNRFFFDTVYSDVQGIDYYSLPKAYLNLMNGRSAFDTFGLPHFGPKSTLYLSHPALAVFLGSWFSSFSPSNGYVIFTIFSLGLMALCCWLLARESQDALIRRLIWLLLLSAFPTYWTLYTGNVQVLLVLALTLLFTGVLAFASGQRGEERVLAGLLLSLLTKPMVLLMLPLLLLLKQTRRAALWALGIYIAISAIFEFVPALNPEAIGLPQVALLTLHPGIVRSTMNIYTNNFHVNAWMKDNSFHWLNLVAQSDTRLMHIDIFSLPVFLDTLLGVHTPAWPYMLPLLIVFVLTILVARIPEQRTRVDAALLLLMAISLVFFLGYPTVWEYQYTSVLPVAAMFLLMRARGVFYAPLLPWLIALAACSWLPSLYFLLPKSNFSPGLPVLASALTVIRVDRVVPVTALFLLMVVALFRETLSLHSLTATSSAEPASATV